MLFPDLFKKPATFTPLHPRAVANLVWATPTHITGIQSINAKVKDPWRREELAAMLRDQQTSTIVAERGNAVAGFLCYHLHPMVLELVHFAVSLEHQHIGVGCQMFDTLDRKLSIHRLPRMVGEIAEDDEATWQWFRGRGMRGCGVERDGVRPGIHNYIFEYWASDPMAAGAGNLPEKCP